MACKPAVVRIQPYKALGLINPSLFRARAVLLDSARGAVPDLTIFKKTVCVFVSFKAYLQIKQTKKRPPEGGQKIRIVYGEVNNPKKAIKLIYAASVTVYTQLAA